MREDAVTKGKRYLVEGRLMVTRVDNDVIAAICRGDGEVYHLRLEGRRWLCNCPARTDRCCHLTALRLVVVRTNQ